MKKQQIAAAACLVAGAIGFAAVYSTQNHGKEELPTEISQTSSIVEPTEKKTPQKTTEKVDSETKMGTPTFQTKQYLKSQWLKSLLTPILLSPNLKSQEERNTFSRI